MNPQAQFKARLKQRRQERLEWTARQAYSLLLLLLLPILAIYLWSRSRKQPEYRLHWAERFWGGGSDARAFAPEGPPILWLHAVSVGETQAAEPLLRAWLARRDAQGRPLVRLLLTHTTPTGRETGARLFADLPTTGSGAIFRQAYLPYDFPWAMARFFSWARPSMGLLMETELWPNLLRRAEARRVPVALINARLSEKSSRQMARFALLARPSLNRLAALLAQTEADAQRFHAQGYRGELVVTGSLKFDVPLNETQIQQGRAWRAQWPHCAVWLLASSREDEEAELFAAWAARWQTAEAPDQSDRVDPSQDVSPRPLLLVVPRHPQRFDRVVSLAESAGLRVARRQAFVPDPDSRTNARLDAGVDVLVGDSLGEMQAYVAASDLVLVGGSLRPLGGQNPLEACAQGRPVFFGPSMFNFQTIADALLASGAGRAVSSAEDFLNQAQALQSDAAAYARSAEAARAFGEAHRGASARTLSALSGLLAGEQATH